MTKRLSTNVRYGNRYLMPQVIEQEPRIAGEAAYSVTLPSGIRFTQCRPASAQDAASCTPTTTGRRALRRGTFNHEEATE